MQTIIIKNFHSIKVPGKQNIILHSCFPGTLILFSFIYLYWLFFQNLTILYFVSNIIISLLLLTNAVISSGLSGLCGQHCQVVELLADDGRYFRCLRCLRCTVPVDGLHVQYECGVGSANIQASMPLMPYIFIISCIRLDSARRGSSWKQHSRL